MPVPVRNSLKKVIVKTIGGFIRWSVKEEIVYFSDPSLSSMELEPAYETASLLFLLKYLGIVFSNLEPLSLYIFLCYIVSQQ